MRDRQSQLIWGLWLSTRIILFTVWFTFFPVLQRDVNYYYYSMQHLNTIGPQSTLIEYPTPIIWILQVPYVLGLGTQFGFVSIFIASMVALDLTTMIVLHRRHCRSAQLAMLIWTTLLSVMGATVYLKFDLITTFLAAMAVLSVAARKDKTGASFVGIGAALKLWPAALWPALLFGDKRRCWRITAVFWSTGIGLALLSFIWAGWQRLISPLTWQGARGLQIESVWASWLMIQRALKPSNWDVALSKWQAFELTGSGVKTWISISNCITVIGLILIVLFYVCWLRKQNRTPLEAALLICFVVLVVIVSGKTLSPQYLLWLIGPLTAAWTLAEEASAVIQYTLRRFTVAVVVLITCTQIVYPIGYDYLIHNSSWTMTVSIVLLIRNTILLATTGWLGWRIWRTILRKNNALS